MNVELIVGLAQAGSVVVAAAMPFLLGYALIKASKYKRKMATLLRDLRFMLRVEATHAQNNKEMLGASQKIAVRQQVVYLYGDKFSGQFTLAKIDAMLAELEGSGAGVKVEIKAEC